MTESSFLYAHYNLYIFRPRRSNIWVHNETGEHVTPVSRIYGSVWVRSHKDGTKRNFSAQVFFDTFSPGK